MQGGLISKQNDLELELIEGGFETWITVQNEVADYRCFFLDLLFVLVDDFYYLRCCWIHDRI